MTPESALMRQITDYLTIKGIWWMRIQPFNGKTESGYWMRSARKGCADLLCAPLRPVYAVNPPTWKLGDIPIMLWLELKSAKGKQTSAQYEFQAEVEAHGHYYLIVRDFTDLERWLTK